DENLGKEALAELMYRGHPYGRVTAGHVSNLRSITLEDLEQQAEDLFTLDRLTVGLSGGYPRDLPNRIAEALNELPSRGAAAAQTYRARHQQDFTIWLRPVQNENRLFALRAARYEVSRSLEDEPFSPEEVEQTKGFLDGYILLYDQTDARKLGYALDDDFL